MVGTLTCRRAQVDPALFIGSGKAAELAQHVADTCAELVIFNHPLSPSQERNLERLLKCQVVDRIGLILDIFARRARSHEGKLQVELAQLRHLSTRLVRGWTHLERQKGGIGLRGPGESQLETDRRLLRARLRQLETRLERLVGQRINSRRQRTRSETPTVALVGYTNSGKSTLFNALTAAEVFAADLLFATLDSTLRRLELPDCEPLVLVDTVGFVRRLPHDLVAAFRSTLEEVRSASLLLHVVDASRDDQRQLMLQQVNGVLQDIGAGDIPQIEVMNKIDLTARGRRAAAASWAAPSGCGCRHAAARVWICCGTPSASALRTASRTRACTCPVATGACARRCFAWHRCGTSSSTPMAAGRWSSTSAAANSDSWHPCWSPPRPCRPARDLWNNKPPKRRPPALRRN